MYKRNLGFFLIMLIVSIALIGCADNTDNSNQEEGNNNDNEVKGGQLDFAYHVQPATLDPHLTVNDATRDISAHIFEALLTLDTSLEVQPMLAESYELSDDRKMITFNLRQGVKFHNGEEMTADDVIASMERWKTLSSQAETYLEEMTFEKEDDYTVIAHIPNPTIQDLYILADTAQFAAIMPEEIIENASIEGVEDMIGTGPYKFVEWKTDNYIHVEKFDDYQSRSEEPNGMSGQKNAYLDDIYFHLITDPSTRIAGLQSGDYDIASDIPPDSALNFLNDDNFQTAVDFSSFTPINFNKKEGVFKDKKIRQAANAAINVEDLLEAAYVNEEFYELDHALVKKEQTGWYSDVGSDVYNTYDPELAKELLDEAGYDGEEVVIITSREYANYYNMSVVVKEQLEAVGMKVKLDVTDWASVSQKREDPEKFDIFFNRFMIRPLPTQYLFMSNEWFGWTDSEELEELSEKILYADSLEEAQSYTDELHEVYWDYIPILKPGNTALITTYTKNVKGFDYMSNPILWNVQLEE
ncbi:ABC transporter substrate-binding protein [Ornithinibacillus sp. 4-3]|uniref:ABC transporter substrate-binding protein n=1 Tax=Ornithinibacillus sp. 4-3 TaxID=3231488 RepID=A0AB39HRK1_9BACI